MFTLHLLGSPELRDAAGGSVQSVLSQPKRFGVLVYLLLSRGFCRRDTLLPLFWPELDAEHARAALRQTVYLLRRSLGNEVIVGRGDDELGVPEGVIWCDAEEFRRAMAEGRHEDALELYRGELLPGFFLTGLGDFERWIEERRVELRVEAARAAVALAERAQCAGELPESIRWWRKAVTLAPTDEAPLRSLLSALHQAGDRAAAVQTYEDFARSLDEQYALEPSVETQALVARIRGDSPPAASAGAAPPSPPRARAEAALPVTASEASPVPPAPAPPTPAAAPTLARKAPSWRRSPGPRVMTLVVAASILAGVAFGLPVLSGESPPDDPVGLAVLPIEDISADSTARYLGDGMTDELIGTLGRVPGLAVTSRTTANAFRGRNLRVRELGRQLDVDYVLEGSVQRAGDRVRLSVRLVETERGRQRWSETFDRPASDVLAIRDEIGERVVDAIRGELALEGGEVAAAPTTSPEAYDHYLRGRFLLGSRVVGTESATEVEQAVRHFVAATRADPGFARAHAALADAYILMSGHTDPREVLPHARAAAEEAIRLDGSDPQAHLALANIRLTYEWDWEGAEREYRRALELDRSLPEAHYSYGRFLRASRRFDDALEHTRRGIALERRAAPDTLAFSVRSGERLANALYFARRYPEASAEARRVLDLDPTSTSARTTLALASQLQGDAEAAIAALEQTRHQFGDRSPVLFRLAEAYARGGRTAEAREILQLLLERSRTQYVPKQEIGAVYFGLGETGEAIRWFEAALRDRPGWWVTNFNASPRYEPLRADPRFRRLLDQIHAPE